MIFLTDNDIILKLAQCDLLDDALIALNAKHGDVYVSANAKYKFKVKDPTRGAQRYGAETHARLISFFNAVKVVNWNGPNEELQKLNSVIGIDTGEAILFSATATVDSFQLLTGDKRSLQALHGAVECKAVADRLSNSVLCLEQVILRLMSSKGFDYVKGKVVPTLSINPDIALLAAFGSGMDSTEANVVDTLNGYIADLQKISGGLLAKL